jgi:hypothetical protein
MTNLNTRLHNLYASKKDVFAGIHEEFAIVDVNCPLENFHGPLLMSVSDKYARQPHPLLVVGQQTNGWLSATTDVDALMRLYEEFNVGEHCGNRVFWSVVRKLECELGSEPLSCAWSNLNKYEYDGSNGRDSDIDSSMPAIDDILVEEIKILQPEVCVFFSGPDYDDRVQQIFAGVEYIPLNDNGNLLSLLRHKDLPALTFRTYHPKYLRMQGAEFENDLISTIANQVQNH